MRKRVSGDSVAVGSTLPSSMSARSAISHFNASLATVNLAMIEALQNNRADQHVVFSPASIKQPAFNEHFLGIIIERFTSERSAIKNHLDYGYIRSYGAIAA